MSAANSLPFLAWVGIVGGIGLGLPLLYALGLARSEARSSGREEVTATARDTRECPPGPRSSCVKVLPRDAA